MPTGKPAKTTTTRRTATKAAPTGARKATSTTRATKAARVEGTAAKAFDFMRQRLTRDAADVNERDINRLKSSVPDKLEAIDTKQLRKELEWVGEMVSRVRTLWDMLFDREFSIDWKSKALVAAGLLYFVLPTDLTPDFIPGIGFIDDALVLGTLWRLIQDKIDDYMSFAGGATRVRTTRTARTKAAKAGS
ncbi:MAG: DUF1232 domain-containing protein [bacterium]|nr:DUF1232 domain-containing protein [Candidatus Kapabacteria bacterium]